VPLEQVIVLVNARAPTALAARDGEEHDIGDLEQRLGLAGRTDIAAIAERMHLVFSASAAGQRRAVLNELIMAVAPMPVVTPDGHGWQVADAADCVLARLVLALWQHADHDPNLDRFGVCSGNACLDAFVDATQARTRLYCSVTCLNRAKVAAFRRKQRHGRSAR
jgi:predicted RNA-binding Zn ribbon-like protein